MSTSTCWTKITQACLLGAAIYIFVEGAGAWPTPLDDKPVSIVEIIEDYESGVVQQKSFDNVMNALGLGPQE